MKLTKSDAKELTQQFKCDHLFVCDIRYDVAKANGSMSYKGPPIPKEMWMEVLAFFKWTYDLTKSESQVRLYVNPTKRLWKAWAYPQEAGTGLTAREIDSPEKNKQRAELFENQDEWIQWGTVHHHCNIGAFQSSTDEADERDVSGLHITVGNLESERFSLHARLYHKADLYEPDMACFWDIGEAAKIIPPEMHNQVAVFQMCEPPPKDHPFPALWKENLIFKRTDPIIVRGREPENFRATMKGKFTGRFPDYHVYPNMDAQDLAVEILNEMAGRGYDTAQTVGYLKDMAGSVFEVMFDAALGRDVTIEEILFAIEEMEESRKVTPTGVPDEPLWNGLD